MFQARPDDVIHVGFTKTESGLYETKYKAAIAKSQDTYKILLNASGTCNLWAVRHTDMLTAHSPVLPGFSLEGKSKGFLGVAFGVKQFYLII